MDGVENKH